MSGADGYPLSEWPNDLKIKILRWFLLLATDIATESVVDWKEKSLSLFVCCSKEGESGSRLALKHFHTSATGNHISNPIYSEAKLKTDLCSFVHHFLGPKILQSLRHQCYGQYGTHLVHLQNMELGWIIYALNYAWYCFLADQILFYEALSKMQNGKKTHLAPNTVMTHFQICKQLSSVYSKASKFYKTCKML